MAPTSMLEYTRNFLLCVTNLWKVEIKQQCELCGKPIHHLTTEVWNSLEFNRPYRGKRSGFAKGPTNAISVINPRPKQNLFSYWKFWCLASNKYST